MSSPALTYLALGDSYTIGEGVALTESFPYQLVQLLRDRGIQITAPEIIAKTGWTTDELLNAINANTFLRAYDLVTLLIGVNNQYRGRGADSYAPEFEELLMKAISFSTDGATGVIVLSIPDWGATPFANGRDTKQIAAEIDMFNQVNRNICHQHGVNYIDITQGTRSNAVEPGMLADDGLHPSSKEYQLWAGRIAAMFN